MNLNRKINRVFNKIYYQYPQLISFDKVKVPSSPVLFKISEKVSINSFRAIFYNYTKELE